MSQQSNGTPIMVQGRIIWGIGQDLFAGKMKTDEHTKQLIIDPKTGQGILEYGFGLAVPKYKQGTTEFSPQWIALYQALMSEAMTIYPNGQPPQDFAWKYKDADVIRDKNGKLYSEREGQAGHIVLSCTTQIPMKWFKWDGQQNVVVSTGFKVGDYVNVQLNIKAHPPVGRGKPGLYLNPSAVQFITEGKPIFNAPSGDQMFGMNAPQYQGQVDAPVMGAMPNLGNAQPPMQQQGMMPMNNPQMQPPAQPQYPQQPPMQQNYQQQYDPNYNVIPQQHQPQQGQMQGNGQGQYGQMNTAMPGIQNPNVQNGSVQNSTPTGMNGMTVPQNAYPSNPPQMPNQNFQQGPPQQQGQMGMPMMPPR